LPNAPFVGAKTVNVPGAESASARSPATTAATNVDKSGTDSASSTMLTAVWSQVNVSSSWTAPVLNPDFSRHELILEWKVLNSQTLSSAHF